MPDSSKLLFVVEDDPDIAGLLKNALVQAGHQVRLFTHGSQVSQAAAKEQPALIILDGMLPDIDGHDVLRMLRTDERTRCIPTMMVSARSSEGDRAAASHLGASLYISKPFRVRELVASVGKLVADNQAS